MNLVTQIKFSSQKKTAIDRINNLIPPTFVCTLILFTCRINSSPISTVLELITSVLPFSQLRHPPHTHCSPTPALLDGFTSVDALHLYMCHHRAHLLHQH